MESQASKTDGNNNTSGKQENENKKDDFFREDKNPLVVSPPEAQTVVIIVKSLALKNKESFKSRVGEAFESVRENASNIVDKVMKVEEQDINSFRNAANNKPISNSPEQLQESKEQYVIPIIGEKYAFNKITLSDEINIEKRWVEQEEIKIPVRYEKVFVDDKEFDAYSETHGIVSQIKDKISDLFHSSNEEDEDEENEDSNGKSPQRIVDNSNTNDIKNEEETTTITTTKNSENNQQQLIPLYAEEITISKKIVKVGEIAISKRRIVEEENVEVDMIKERINVEYGDGRKEKITPY